MIPDVDVEQLLGGCYGFG